MIRLNNIQKKWLYRALVMLIFIFAFALRVHHLSEKKNFHIDEVYSLILADYTNLGWTEILPQGTYTGAELKSMFFKIDPSVDDAFKDLIKLWKDNRDSPHTNFYYSLLRLSLIGLDAEDNVDFQRQYIFRAGALNLILFTLSFFAFLVLLKLIFKDKTLILLGLVVAFINRADISNALYLRPYVMQGLFVIIFTAFMVRVSQKLEECEYKKSLLNLLVFALPLSLMLLTGYYAFIYAFFFGLFFLAFPMRRTKSLNLTGFFLCGGALALIYDKLFYNSFFAALKSYRTYESIGIVKHKNFANTDTIFDTFTLLESNLFYSVSLLLLAFLIIYKLRTKTSFEKMKKYSWIIAVCFISVFLIMFVSPIKRLHYTYPYLYIFALIYPLAFDSMKTNCLKNIMAISIALVFLCIAIKGDGIQYKYENKKMIPSSFVEEILITTPVYLCFGEYQRTLSPQLITKLDDEQIYVIYHSTLFFLRDMKDEASIVLARSCYDELMEENGFECIAEPPLHMPYSLYRNNN